MTAAAQAEPVIVGAEIAAGHDGAAELVVQLRYPNGAEEPVVLDAEHGLDLMRRCGAATLDDLAGHSWRKILGGT
jgi:hypothetical protein